MSVSAWRCALSHNAHNSRALPSSFEERDLYGSNSSSLCNVTAVPASRPSSWYGHMVNQGMPLRVIQRDTTHAVQTVCSSSCWTSKLHTQPKLLPNLFHSTAHTRRYTRTPSVSQCMLSRLGTSRLTAYLHNGTRRECLAGARTPTDDAERGIHGNLHRSKLFVAQVHRRI